jgi:hypothetical protein
MRKRAVLALGLFALSCHPGQIARWTGRSQGTVSFNAGMTLKDAQRLSTLKLNEYGDSMHYFDFVLAGEPIRVPGCILYGYSIRHDDGRIEYGSVASADESWPALLRNAREIETLLLAHRWKRDPRTNTLASLPTNPRDAAESITGSGAIDAFDFVKGNIKLRITPSGHWGGIPWWRPPNRAKVFWHFVGVSLIDEDEMKRIRAAYAAQDDTRSMPSRH